MKKDVHTAIKEIETTIGELVETLTEIARQAVDTDTESYQLASEAFSEIIKNSNNSIDLEDLV